ncbi:glutathione S-transferase family protein, partial [Phenylobacterium sp.]|uniref:glutathione S-transferase family protein n=1 Tax=Phenylobacterium sp. TaxID=1871053 RepID=UPI0025DD8602
AAIPFDFELVDLGDPEAAARYRTISPFGKMPAIDDGGVVVWESTLVIDHLARTHPAAGGLLPRGGAGELEVRLWDRVFDLYVSSNMQKIVGDRRRPSDQRDRMGTDQARADLRTAYALIEAHMAGRVWAAGEAFTLADCAAAPGLYYAQRVEPFDPGHPNVAAYFERLLARPSFARVLEEARPYLHMFPEEPG